MAIGIIRIRKISLKEKFRMSSNFSFSFLAYALIISGRKTGTIIPNSNCNALGANLVSDNKPIAEASKSLLAINKSICELTTLESAPTEFQTPEDNMTTKAAVEKSLKFIRTSGIIFLEKR